MSACSFDIFENVCRFPSTAGSDSLPDSSSKRISTASSFESSSSSSTGHLLLLPVLPRPVRPRKRRGRRATPNRNQRLRRRRGLGAVLLVEALDAAGGVDELLLARVERVAGRTDVNHEVPARRVGLDLVAAGAGNLGLFVNRMNAFLSHGVPRRGVYIASVRRSCNIHVLSRLARPGWAGSGATGDGWFCCRRGGPGLQIRYPVGACRESCAATRPSTQPLEVAPPTP